jgi:PhzF family phenazine biosynthesis protein
VQLVWRESYDVFHVRNPFPPGGVVEDPATGAAAAAFGGYLRDLGLVGPPATVAVHQGHDMGRPSLLTVTIPAEPGSGIDVTGTAVPL